MGETKTGWNWNDREILRYLGIKGQMAPDSVEKLIEECKAELERQAVPKAVWREFPLTLSPGGRIDMECLQTESRDLGRSLRDCDRVLLFAATLGVSVDLLLKRYGKLAVSHAVVLQAVSVAMLETFCDETMETLKGQYLEQGLYLRPRFSPGYGDFSLESQRQILPALDVNRKLGVTLTDSLLMVPAKSVTAVAGISPVPGNCRVEGCEICGKTDCAYRRKS